MDPSTALHVTAVLEVPVTEDVNCFVWPDCNTAELGDTETPIGTEPPVTVTGTDA